MIPANSARLWGAFSATCALLWPHLAPADRAAAPSPTTSLTSPRLTEFEVGAGFWALPTGQVCTRVECGRGELSPSFHLLALAHLSPRWALGAGGHFALLPSGAPEPLDADAPTFRELARSYLWLEAEARWFPWRSEMRNSPVLDWWFGTSAGLVLLSDRYFGPLEDEVGPLRIGDRGVTLSTSGLSLRPSVGVDWSVADAWALGAQLRPGMMWFPGERKETPFGDQATLSGVHWSAAASLALKVRLPW